jgi:hypothetical protein
MELLRDLLRSVGRRANCYRAEWPQSAADIDAAYSPAVAHHDATPGHITSRLVDIVVTAIAVRIVISEAPIAETKAAATEATTAEATATMTAAPAAAMTSAPMGKRSRAGCTQQDRRGAGNAEAADGEYSDRRKTARQDVAAALAVLGHRYSFPDLHAQVNFADIAVNRR